MTLSGRLELEFGDSDFEFRGFISSASLHFNSVTPCFIIWASKIDVSLFTSTVQCSNIWNQGRRSSGRAGGGQTSWRQWKRIKNKTIIAIFRPTKYPPSWTTKGNHVYVMPTIVTGYQGYLNKRKHLALLYLTPPKTPGLDPPMLFCLLMICWY